ncbi:MAG: myxosortase MrtX [Myxococcaceae bacterium]
MTNVVSERLSKLNAVQEALLLWAASFVAIVISFVIWRDAAKVVATVTFLYLPLLAMDLRGEDYPDYGVTLSKWKQDLGLFALFVAIVTPLYALGFVVYQQGLHVLPPEVSARLSPLSGVPHFHFRLPDRFGEWVIDQIFVVALPEEFFYRGYIQTRLRDAWPQGRKFLGVRLGPAFWVTAALFALGHLAIFEVWRLGVFFPALLFAWMREKTGTVLGSALFHAYCNLLALVMTASFFGR